MPEQHDTIIIRNVRLTDAAAIAHARISAWRAAYRGLLPDTYLDRPDVEALEALHLHGAVRDLADTARISVAEVGGQIIGYCAYGTLGDASSQPLHGRIYDLFVHPAAWHGGVGRKLLTYATQQLRAQGFAAAILFVYEANARDRAFYQQAGWEADGHRDLDTQAEVMLAALRYRKDFGG